jgi:hypothetical protein
MMTRWNVRAQVTDAVIALGGEAKVKDVVQHVVASGKVPSTNHTIASTIHRALQTHFEKTSRGRYKIKESIPA